MLKSNLGPTGTIKMFAWLGPYLNSRLTKCRLVDGAGGVGHPAQVLQPQKGLSRTQIKLTKDGNVLLREMVRFIVD